MPTSFGRGPPFWILGARWSAYFESRHSVPYADIGIRNDIVVIRELFEADGADATLLSDLSVQQLSHLSR
jgi:hypothetical protein